MTIIWCMIPEIWSMRDIIFCHSGLLFALLLLPMDSENQNFEKMKKTHQDIIILQMCTINDSHMMCGSCNVECNRQNFLSFWTVFCLTTWKIKILKKWKKSLEILPFYTGVPKMTIIWCMVLEIWSMTDRIFCHFRLFFALLPLLQPEKSKFWKTEKNTWRYHYFTHVYHKWQSYGVLFLTYRTWQT